MSYMQEVCPVSSSLKAESGAISKNAQRKSELLAVLPPGNKSDWTAALALTVKTQSRPDKINRLTHAEYRHPGLPEFLQIANEMHDDTKPD